MKRNRIDQIAKPRFRVAVHVLVWLAKSGGVLSSAAIAAQVKTHATFLRRVMAQLNRAGIVEAKEGRDGGYYMTRCPKELTLAEIYRSLPEEREEEQQEELDCGEVGVQLDRQLEALLHQAEQQLVRFLGQYTLADVMDSIGFGQIGPSEEWLEMKQENRLL